ncbi:MAG: hypothetical protein GX338_11725 [Firmicutes bacterium]|nr:hypothetical protein [Bacillota bacterium]
MWLVFLPPKQLKYEWGIRFTGSCTEGNELEFHLHSLLVHNLLQYASGMRDVSERRGCMAYSGNCYQLRILFQIFDVFFGLPANAC